MKNIWMLTCANLRKGIRSSIAFLLLTITAAFLLNTSLLLSNGFKTLFSQKIRETNSADYTAILPRTYYEDHKDTFHKFFQSQDGSLTYESMDSILFRSTDLQKEGKDKLRGTWNIRNADRTQKMSAVKIIEQLEIIPEDAIYVPYICKTFFQYQLGDQLTFSSPEGTYTYHIAGYTEDVLFGSKSSLAFDLPKSGFDALAKSVDENALAAMLMVQTTDPTNKLELDFAKLLGAVPFFSSSSIDTSNFSRTSSLSIYNAMMMAFSVINVMICIIIIRYRIKNMISLEMRNIGALKAIGHTDLQIISSYIVQFGMLGLAGSVIGCSIVYLSIRSIISSIAVDIGFVWNNRFMPHITIPCIFFVVGCTIITSWISTEQIRKISPITALRGGTASHNFRTNFVPFDTSPFCLSSTLAFKTTLSNKKQSSWIAVILSAVIMTSAFAVILFSNMVLDRNGLLQVTGAEIFSVISIPSRLQDSEEIAETMAQNPKVSKVIKTIDPGNSKLLCDDSYNSSLTVYDDYSALERSTIYEGRYPKHDNETAISGNLAKLLGKNIGDTVTLTQLYQTPVYSESYLITGLTQGTFSGGIDVFLTMPGLQKIRQVTEWESIRIYLHDGTDIDAYIDTITQQFGTALSYTANYEELFQSQFQSNVDIVSLMVIFILFLTAAIVMLVIFLVVHSILLRDNQKFGIMKAIGYTTGQIVHQVAVSLLPIVLIGGAVGCILASFAMDTIVGMLFGSMGVNHVDFTIPIFPLLILVAVVCLLTYGIALLGASGVRKISPCDMLNQSSQ